MTTKQRKPVTAIHVMVGDAPKLVELDSSNLLKEMQTRLGGLIEFVDLYDSSIVLNEEGKLLSLDRNDFASYLWHLDLFREHSIFWNDDIRGDVLIVGPTDRHGNTTSIPKGVQKRIFAEWNTMYAL